MPLHRRSSRAHASLVAACALALTVPAALLAPPAWSATGDVAEFGLPDAGLQPQGIAAAADGTMWITLGSGGVLAKSTATGTVSVVLSGGSAPNPGADGVVVGPDSRVWFTARTAGRITAVTPATGASVDYPLPSSGSGPTSITVGPDGALWFTEASSDRIGRITTSGTITEFPVPADSAPTTIVSGPDGALWFTLRGASSLGRMTTGGVLTTFPTPTASSAPTGLAVGPDGNLWFTEATGNRIGRMTTAGLAAEFVLPTASSGAAQIASAPDGNLWFTMTNANRIGRITPAGVITQYSPTTASSAPVGITVGADGNVWFTERDGNRIGRILTGVAPVIVTAPGVTAPATSVGSVLTATAGTWRYLPTGYTYQWQRCTAVDPLTCTAIAGATAATYTLTTSDAGQRLRVQVTATNLNGASAAAPSSPVSITALPPAPIPPAVVGGQSATVATGVTATLKGPKSVRRGAMRWYAVRLSSPQARGTVRMSIVDSTGREVRVLAAARPLNSQGAARALARVPFRVAPGYYTLRAVFTPEASQVTTYAAATLSKPIRIRP